MSMLARGMLELGCGTAPTPGYIHHDRRGHSPHVEVVHDLDKLSWPWLDAGCAEILALDVFEHLHLMPEVCNEPSAVRGARSRNASNAIFAFSPASIFRLVPFVILLRRNGSESIDWLKDFGGGNRQSSLRQDLQSRRSIRCRTPARRRRKQAHCGTVISSSR
jgi:hypothetical protein